MAEDVQLGLEYLTVRAQWQRLQLTICLTVTTRVLNAMELAFSTSLTVGEISSDLYRFVQCDIKKCAFDSLKLEKNPQNFD